MEHSFVVEVDADGKILSLEEGDGSSMSTELLSLLGRFAAGRIAEQTFIWAPRGSDALHRVRVSPASHADTKGDSVYATVEPLGALPFGLTLRELDVLTMLALGMASNAIAERLGLSPRTITTHVDRVLRKMGALGRTAAAVMAVDQGVIRVPFPGASQGEVELLRLGRTANGNAQSGDARRRIVRKPLVIGAALPLRGVAVADGVEMARASQLAVEELNARGGVDGRKITLDIVGVDLLEKESVRSAFEALVARQVDVITSGYLAHQDVAHELAADARIPYLHAATLDAMTRRVRDDSTRYGLIFQVCPSDSNYAPRFVEMMSRLRDQGLWQPRSRRLVIVQRAWEQTDLGIERAGRIAERDGWNIEFAQVDASGASGWEDFARRASASEPGAIMVGNYFVEDTVAFVRSFLSNPSETLLYSLYSPSVPEFRESMGPASDGLLWATVTGTYSDAHARSFATRFRARFGVNPGRSHAGIAYDRVGLIAHAWKYAENPRDAELVAEELRQSILRGVNGVYYFGDASQAALSYEGASGDPSLSQAHLVFQIQGGRQRIIDPSPYSDGTFMLPPWFTKTRDA